MLASPAVRVWIACLASSAGLACQSATEPPPLVPLPEVAPGPPVVARLTAEQYRNSLRDLFGANLVLPPALEPDSAAGGLLAVGAGETSISSWGVEQYESAAYSVAAQVLAEGSRGALMPCQPSGVVDSSCARSFLTQVGLHLWRRPLTEEELTPLVAVAEQGATTLADFYAGLEFGLAALLQSPNFLFRAELGQDGAYDDYQLAARLSFFLWNSAPDEALLAAAAAGQLRTDDGLAAQAQRLIEDPRAHRGLRAFFSDLFELYRLDALNKDPTVYVHFSTDLGKFAREETLLDLERLIFEEDADYRELFISERTSVNRRLAALYGVAASAQEGYGVVQLPPAGGRRGLLGQASFLALRSHPSSSSAVLRGAFVRKVLLCQVVPPPPVGLNTALPEPSATARTLRERNVVHLQEPSCAGCHSRMDPIGLGLERFDGIGRYRSEDNGAPIDASGELDGVAFSDAWTLAQVVHDHPDVPGCLVRSLYRYATGAPELLSEAPLLSALTSRFQASGHRVKALLYDLVTNPSFTRVDQVVP